MNNIQILRELDCELLKAGFIRGAQRDETLESLWIRKSDIDFVFERVRTKFAYSEESTIAVFPELSLVPGKTSVKGLTLVALDTQFSNENSRGWATLENDGALSTWKFSIVEKLPQIFQKLESSWPNEISPTLVQSVGEHIQRITSDRLAEEETKMRVLASARVNPLFEKWCNSPVYLLECNQVYELTFAIILHLQRDFGNELKFDVTDPSTERPLMCLIQALASWLFNEPGWSLSD